MTSLTGFKSGPMGRRRPEIVWIKKGLKGTLGLGMFSEGFHIKSNEEEERLRGNRDNWKHSQVLRVKQSWSLTC